MAESLTDNYKGYNIVAEMFIDISGYLTVLWSIYFKNSHVLTDRNTIDGVKLTHIRQAVNDAKRNIDALYRLNIQDK